MKQISDEARAVHNAAIVIDLHADTPKLMSRRYDIAREHSWLWPASKSFGHIDIPRMRAGGLAAQWFGMWTFPYPRRGCAADVHRQLDALAAAEKRLPATFRMACSGDDVRRAHRDGVCAGLRGIEGAHALEGNLDNLVAFARRGLRYLGLLHFSRNDVGCPAAGMGRNRDSGLTRFGRDVIDACGELGVIVDLAHINRAGFFDATRRSRGPVIVSHTGVAGVRQHWRNIDDEQIKAVADSGGVIGIIFAPAFIGGHLEAVVDHLCYVIKVAGAGAVALGSDWDGAIPMAKGLESPAQLPALTEALLRRRLSPDTVHQILGGNVLRVLDHVPVSNSC
ncbi:dipeptidase [Mycobacteroides abscessus]|uniref:dipeptidase n=1 Tax=Mycobacteroides abscessus TaxID=36809 RepID=UPI0009A8C39C|nr:dipeptidase [Mycobacteroides abscessus]SKF27792.1 Putative dipeptidase [Mycobacteroides abscessus subsp. abscessus]SKR35797.1 Putative dipeptidase [Mycobacteroides abscessus subsp. abscessus]